MKKEQLVGNISNHAAALFSVTFLLFLCHLLLSFLFNTYSATYSTHEDNTAIGESPLRLISQAIYSKHTDTLPTSPGGTQKVTSTDTATESKNERRKRTSKGTRSVGATEQMIARKFNSAMRREKFVQVFINTSGMQLTNVEQYSLQETEKFFKQLIRCFHKGERRKKTLRNKELWVLYFIAELGQMPDKRGKTEVLFLFCYNHTCNSENVN